MKKIIFLIMIILLFIPIYINAEEMKEVWKNNLTGVSYENFVETSKEEIIVVGYVEAQNVSKKDGLIIKYNKDGEEIWKKTWGGSKHDVFEKIVLLENGEFVVTGQSESDDVEGMTDFEYGGSVIVKFDEDGNVKWQKHLGIEDYNTIYELKITKKNEIIILYSNDVSRESGFIAKYDSNGNELWKENLDDKGLNIYLDKKTYKIELLEDDSIILCGANIIQKYDSTGNILWKNEIELVQGIAGLNSFKITENDEIIAVGESGNKEFASEGLLIKYDKNGREVWRKTKTKELFLSYLGIDLLDNGEYLVFGNYMTENGRIANALIMKYNKDNEIIWEYEFEKDDIYPIEYVTSYETLDNGLLVVAGLGVGESGIPLIMKFDKDGKLEWKKADGHWDIYAYPLKYLKMDNGIIIYGNAYDSTPIFKYDNYGKLLWELDIDKNKNGNTAKIDISKSNKLLVLESERYSENGKMIYNALLGAYSFEYDIEMPSDTVKGTTTVVQEGRKGIITPKPNKGYTIDKVSVKDIEGNEIEVTKQEDGTYTFKLFKNVKVEVTYKEELTNPKTGDNILVSVIVLFISLITSIISLIVLKKRNNN